MQPNRSWAARMHSPAPRALPEDYEIIGVANTIDDAGPGWCHASTMILTLVVAVAAGFLTAVQEQVFIPPACHSPKTPG